MHPNFRRSIRFPEQAEMQEIPQGAKTGNGNDKGNLTPLQNAIVRGLKEKAGNLTKEKLKEEKPLEIIQKDVIPALNVVGADFEKKKVYLPQLLMAAEAAKAAFEEVKKQWAHGTPAEMHPAPAMSGCHSHGARRHP